ncbi:uncharacterized protein LOC106153522 [Lingula anatina]|uniref:Uncharacterized protein LOC106153522 n=1 Tax=Lingula anatina TaxID=7574 RepID=A0A1S3HBQ0_LINAN|nr:uncharacterized protein LOC106153522 [Lingula anatina]|eukprot:XP_013382951.1 uncharacterized protein LOC106153522 [Lingula anatina]
MAHPTGGAAIHTRATTATSIHIEETSKSVSLASGPYNQHNFAVFNARRAKADNNESKPNFIKILPWGGRSNDEGCMDGCCGKMTWYAVVAFPLAVTLFGWWTRGSLMPYLFMFGLCLLLTWHIAAMVIIKVNQSRFESNDAWYLIKLDTNDSIDGSVNGFFKITARQANHITFSGVAVNQEQINMLQYQLLHNHEAEIDVMLYNWTYQTRRFSVPFRSIFLVSILYIGSLVLHGMYFINAHSDQNGY